jgi:hypothetical protein
MRTPPDQAMGSITWTPQISGTETSDDLQGVVEAWLHSEGDSRDVQREPHERRQGNGKSEAFHESQNTWTRLSLGCAMSRRDCSSRNVRKNTKYSSSKV